jgi:hypothetical protein
VVIDESLATALQLRRETEALVQTEPAHQERN